MNKETTDETVSDGTKRSILLVEDDFFVRDIYQRKLIEMGFDVHTASDGLEGLARLQEGVPDLVLLDIFMPYMDGRDLLREMKANPLWKDIPVILLTNFSASEGVHDGFDLGADEYLIKSHFTPSEVTSKINAVFEERKKNDILKAANDDPNGSEENKNG
ncbi:MAG: response regulator [Candidatus Moraniibacteriota bacterium]